MAECARLESAYTARYPGFESLPHRQWFYDMILLTPEAIESKLKEFPGWQLEDKALMKEFVFPTFTDAMVFVNEVAQAAEDMNHHPNIGIHYNKVILRCHTHDMDGVTEKDIDLVKKAQDAEKMVFGELSKA